MTITVRLPEYIGAVHAFEVTEDGLLAVPCQVKDRQVILKLDTIESGRVFVLRRR